MFKVKKDIKKVCAIVLAAGTGSRMGSEIKKQFIEVNGKPLIYYSLKAVVTVLAAVARGIKALTGKDVDVNVNKNVNGSHANGLDYVPFDGYIAQLHKGERIQTAEEANDWRSGLIAAKKAINFTMSYPLNSIPSGSISNSYNNGSKIFNISGITIQTQATDAQGIATDFAYYIKQAVISLDDGMIA